MARARLIGWTPAMDADLWKMRGQNYTWDAIGWALGISRTAVLARARAIASGADLTPLRNRAGLSASRVPRTPERRQPMAAGHPVSWAILNEGLSLAGTPYPSR